MAPINLKALAFAGAVVSASADRHEHQPERHADFMMSTKSGGTTKAVLEGLGADFQITNEYTTAHNGVKHTYIQQMVNGIPVQNCVAQINEKDGNVLSFASSFFQGETPVPPTKALKIGAAPAMALLMTSLEAEASDCTNEVDPSLRYVATEENKLELAYRIECDLTDNWMESYVSAETGKVIAQLDYFHNADDVNTMRTSGTYSVFTLPDVDPAMAGNIPQVVSQPHAGAYPPEAATLGWHDQGDGKTFTTTIGNNVYAQNNPKRGNSFLDNYRPDGGASLNFNYTYNHDEEPDTSGNVDSAIQNLFYLNNLQHDIFYGYGFDEVSGNFQENNLGRGGREGDAVQANAQDGGGTNNANFATPADGSRPRMNMYIWTDFTPARDGDLEAGIVFHEYGHGISNRLTGGPSNTGCLSGVKQGAGMGEGWSDFFGKIIALREGDVGTDTYPMGDWIRTGGIRTYPYSTDMSVNPLTFGDMNSSPYSNAVHAAGTVSCTVLWDAMWDMIDVYGFDSDIRACGTGGNNKMLQLVVDGLKLQPCRPTMVDARDAIILADEVNNNGENFCLLWNAFARRGFGVGAKAAEGFFGRYTEDFETPTGC